MYALKQYQFVQESRNVLFEYCQSILPEDFIKENSSFGRGGSIRNLLVHIANTYEFWIAKNALGKEVNYSGYGANKNIRDVIELFNSVDGFMSEFIEAMPKSERKIEYESKGVKKQDDPLKLFTHVITHEYHHKGQILSLSRPLGYVPV